MLEKKRICPCCSGKEYHECCKPIHEDHKLAKTATQLMRARYSAYVLRNQKFLLVSWDKAKRPQKIEFGDIEWLKLEVIMFQQGGAFDKHGIVEFKAEYKDLENSYNLTLHEKSNFVRRGRFWYYVDGYIN